MDGLALVAVGFVAGAIASGFFGAIGGDLWAATKLLPTGVRRKYRSWRIRKLLGRDFDIADLKVWMFDEEGNRVAATMTPENIAASGEAWLSDAR